MIELGFLGTDNDSGIVIRVSNYPAIAPDGVVEWTCDTLDAAGTPINGAAISGSSPAPDFVSYLAIPILNSSADCSYVVTVTILTPSGVYGSGSLTVTRSAGLYSAGSFSDSGLSIVAFASSTNPNTAAFHVSGISTTGTLSCNVVSRTGTNAEAGTHVYTNQFVNAGLPSTLISYVTATQATTSKAYLVMMDVRDDLGAIVQSGSIIFSYPGFTPLGNAGATLDSQNLSTLAANASLTVNNLSDISSNTQISANAEIWSSTDSENLATIATNSGLMVNSLATMASNSTTIANNTQISANAEVRIADASERMAVALEKLSDDIRALKVVGVDHNAGIVTRDTCNPCDLGHINNMSRALTVVALKSSKQLGDVITELKNPTPLPTPSQDFD